MAKVIEGGREKKGEIFLCLSLMLGASNYCRKGQ